MAKQRVQHHEPVRYAVIGLGHIAQAAVLPAFDHAHRNSRLAALVSDDATKRRKLSRKYGVPAVAYESYDELLASGDIDAVYIALPNHLHCDYAERAARAGVHVLCEKPLAVTESECERMIHAAADADVRLMTAYRLHFEPATLEAVKLARLGRLGVLRCFTSTFTMQVKRGNVRLHPVGGGPLYDIGIYCVNAARMLFGAEPTRVFAAPMHGDGDARFRQVEESVAATLWFPDDRIATFTCSFGASDVSSYRLVGTKGDLVVEPAYEYQEGLAHRLTRNGRTRAKRFAPRDQFAPELLHFSDCVQKHREPGPGGIEGLIDVQIIEALRESMRSGKPVEVATAQPPSRPSEEQRRRAPAVREPALVRAESASQ
jgi:glucose-fructose oxidoreductase